MPYADPEKRKAHYRKKAAQDRAANREYFIEYNRRYRQENPDYFKNYAKSKWAKHKQRMKTDPEYALAYKAMYEARYARERAERLAKVAERWRTDPEYRARKLAADAARRKTKTTKKPQQKTLPSWLAGTLPKVTPTSTRLHLASVEESGARRSA